MLFEIFEKIERNWNAIRYLLRTVDSIEARLEKIEKRLADLESTNRRK